MLDSGKITSSKNSYIRVQCPYCNKEYDIQFGQFNMGRNCNYCCNKYENSFAYHIEVELGLDINDIWDFEKNTVNPYYIYKSGTTNKVWIKCQEVDYHGSYEITCGHFTEGKRCSYCHKGNTKVHYFDSLGFLYHNIARMIVEDERNNISWEDMYEISTHSGKAFYFKCLKCGKESDKKIILSNIQKNKYSCKYCSDGISVPERFMANLLNELGIDFITQLSKTKFNWCGKYRYDFYIPSLNMIIETHGEQHYEENTFKSVGGKSLKEEQENDRLKRELALNNKIDNYIVVDCRYSALDWLKENTIKELDSIFDLSNIDWNDVWERCQSSLVIETWKLWNKGLNTKEISKELKLSIPSVCKYLNNGNKLEMCKYNGKEELIKSNRGKATICLTANKIFNSATEGSKYCGLKSSSSISMCCLGDVKSAGKHPITDEKLVWRYLVWKHNKVYRVKNQLLINKNNIA